MGLEQLADRLAKVEAQIMLHAEVIERNQEEARHSRANQAQMIAGVSQKVDKLDEKLDSILIRFAEWKGMKRVGWFVLTGLGGAAVYGARALLEWWLKR